MIEFNKNHYLDLEDRRVFYKQKLGEPINTDIYNYYINMIGVAIDHRSKDADFNHMAFPYSIGTKQELVKIIMIIQADAKAAIMALEGSAPAVVEAKPAKKKLFKKWKRK